MKQDVEKHIRIAEKILRDMEQLMAGGFHKEVVKRAYLAMFNAATAALLAEDVQCGNRQTVVSDFNITFVKTGLLDEKLYKYFCHASNSKADADDSSFAYADDKQAQTNLIRVKEFVTACRTLCD
jgi:uncharacterized protein (UPF0332 family)